MRAAGVAGVSRRRAPRTTRRDSQAQPAPDRVERRFEADAPNRLWVADITYVPTLVGFLYLAIVLDVFSRRVVGWAMATHLRTELRCATAISSASMTSAHREGSPYACHAVKPESVNLSTKSGQPHDKGRVHLYRVTQVELAASVITAIHQPPASGSTFAR